MGPFDLIVVVAAVCVSSPLPLAPENDVRLPESVIEAFQGSWILDAKRSVMLADNTISEFLPRYRLDLATIRIDKRLLTLSDKKSSVNLDESFRVNDAMPKNGDEPVMILRMADGRTVTASFVVQKDEILMRIPARCCSRSGVWLQFVRTEDHSHADDASDK